MQRKHLGHHGALLTLALLVLTAAGCAVGPAGDSQAKSDREVFELRAITPSRAAELLGELELGEVTVLPEGHAVAVVGPERVREKAAVVLDLVDSPLPYKIEVLASVSQARSLPANEQFAAILSTAAIGTFAQPPAQSRARRAIIDIHNDAVIAIAPVPLARDIVTLAQFGPTALLPVEEEAIPVVTVSEDTQSVIEPIEATSIAETQNAELEPILPEAKPEEIISAGIWPEEPGLTEVEPEVAEAVAAPLPAEEMLPVVAEEPAAESAIAEPEVLSGTVHEAALTAPVRPVHTYDLAPLTNGDDVLQLDLPDRLELIQLLDLVAEYLGLDYLYDPKKIQGETVSLRLHGKLQGEIHVKELYPLLESVLKFKGLAMTSHEGNLVTILPVDDALKGDPTLLDEDSSTLGAGDLVVTRAFELRYVTTASATTFLENMELSMSVSPVSETRTLIVTCYAHRMERIERLLNMVDRPGPPRNFRFRQLKYTLAGSLVKKVETLVGQLQAAPVKIVPNQTSASTSTAPILLTSSAPKSTSSSLSNKNAANEEEEAEQDTVYLDADERTNRILMIGPPERLAVVEEVIDALDVPQRDPRMLKVYAIVHLRAADVVEKLETLGVIGRTKPSPAPTTPPAILASQISSPAAGGDVTATTKTEATQVTVLDATNSLLINATDEEHARIREVVDHIDVAPQDLRYLEVYDVKFVDAEAMRQKLIEFEVIGGEEEEPVPEAAESREATGAIVVETRVATLQRPQVTVRESTNSLLVNATTMQHARIADLIAHIDVVQQDLRVMREYSIEYVDATEVKDKLEEFGLIGADTERPSATPAKSSDGTPEVASTQRPQVAVLESTNSLLINATAFQHAQMAAVIEHVDKEVRQDAIPYEIYFLESQDPETLAGVLEKLIQQRKADPDDKIDSPTQRPQDEIKIVPDPGTFSLVVNASRKNQEWISKLIRSLDKLRPQVLIDVTLVEITETDQFTYDLNLVQSSPSLHSTSAVSGVDPNSNALGRLFQSGSGLFTGFYGDNHIQALLEAVQSKNYGRVLAKPKILVNDNEPGVIKTTETTYVETRSSSLTSESSSLVETSMGYDAYDAGITLEITPHISEGQLLRLDISLVRSDFVAREDRARPPDTTASEVTTAVTVPDGSTIILGGLLKLNQTKGGKKVPLLGDVPLIGGAFRSVNNSDKQSKLYVFVKAEIIRPTDGLIEGMGGLEVLSQRNRAAFEDHEAQFQAYQAWPGVTPKPVEPARVLDAR